MDIILPQPCKSGGMPLMEAISCRRSHREYEDKDLDLQTLADLLWAAWGYVSKSRRSAPSSHNRQEIDLYLFMRNGVYLYDAAENILRMKDERDLREATGLQPYVAGAALNIVMVSDTSKITGKTPQGIIEATYADTGFISQNIYLYCASKGLGSVIRAMIDKERLASLLNLSDTQIITLVHTVGVKAEANHS